MAFPRDYLMYSLKGAIRIGVAGREWTLPPSFAAWIPADTPLQIQMSHPTTCCSVLFKRGFTTDFPDRAVVFSMPQLTREMISFSRRWGPDAAEFTKQAEVFFRALAMTCGELAESPCDIWRPVSPRADVGRAICYTEENLDAEITLTEVARASGLSERTLLRRFTEDLGMTWTQTLRRLRMIRAVELLSEEGNQIVQVSLNVGYNSNSAFNKAFREFSGLTPSAFRKQHLEGRFA